MWDLWWTKWHWGWFSQSTSVSPANLHFTNCFTIIIIIWGWYNTPIVAAVPSGLSLTPLRIITRKQELYVLFLLISRKFKACYFLVIVAA
jgi:hypothetical protein